MYIDPKDAIPLRLGEAVLWCVLVGDKGWELGFELLGIHGEEAILFRFQVFEHFGVNLVKQLRMSRVPDERRVELRLRCAVLLEDHGVV